MYKIFMNIDLGSKVCSLAYSIKTGLEFGYVDHSFQNTIRLILLLVFIFGSIDLGVGVVKTRIFLPPEFLGLINYDKTINRGTHLRNGKKFIVYSGSDRVDGLDLSCRLNDDRHEAESGTAG
ncbi:hypothetical protein P167DRAFT_549358 [Morchella conica CCBAS932]|uniref:Uncharacterized protein n=1 Tax=Morchella conica CCBAS932 TaxID=1392247 RepID=A0A3N4KF03_9PEZI|nr:hypothetical protein P167DRAFT_549358 [Morchella conica CCBAS932]